jgi:hypothetical protein
VAYDRVKPTYSLEGERKPLKCEYPWLLFEQVILSFVHKRLAAKAVIKLDAFRISVQDRSKMISGGLRLPFC